MMHAEDLLNKYRPQKFAEVLGQEAVVKSLTDAIAKRRGHAFLFVGPSGTGKTTLAYIAAHELGCTDFDIRDVDAATYTGIDNMRQVMDELQYRPLSGATKAVIVDEAHALSKQAFTSSLKTLEKPPEWAYWFLCTTEGGKVPENIRTRCLRYELKPVSRFKLIELLERVLDKEKHDLGKDEARILDLCAKEAGGSPRKALSNLGVCWTARTREEAAELLLVADEGSPQAIDFVRAVYRGAKWNELKGLLVPLADTSAESLRQVVRAYGTKIALNSKGDGDFKRAARVLQAFAQPCYGSDGITPIVLACSRLFRDED